MLWGCTMFAFHSTSSNSTNASEICHLENRNLDTELSLGNRIRLDLTSGVWMTDDICQKSNVSIQFNQKGNANFIFEAKENTRPDFLQYSWELEKIGSMYFLIWSEEQCQKESMFKIEQTCEGILLTDPATDSEICLKKMPKIADNKMDFLRMSLIGNWENASYPFVGSGKKKMKNAFFHYQFNANGTYLIEFGNRKRTFSENGNWEISRDGKYVLFYQNGKKINLAKIAHLDLDEMVLKPRFAN